MAKQTLANLEGGRGNPTVETLLAVARALGIEVGSLLTQWGSPVLIQRHEAAQWIRETGGRRRSFDQIYGTGQVATALQEVSGAREVRAALTPGSLHHVYVIAESALTGPVDDARLLGPGDFSRFAADTPHVLRAERDRAVLHMVTTVPQAQQFAPA